MPVHRQHRGQPVEHEVAELLAEDLVGRPALGSNHVGVEAEHLAKRVDEVVEILRERQALFAREQHQDSEHEESRALTFRPALLHHAGEHLHEHDGELLEGQDHATSRVARPVRAVGLAVDALRLVDRAHREGVRVLAAAFAGDLVGCDEGNLAVELLGQREHGPEQGQKAVHPHAGLLACADKVSEPGGDTLRTDAVQVEDFLRVHDAFLARALEGRAKVGVRFCPPERNLHGLPKGFARVARRGELRQVRNRCGDGLGRVDRGRRDRAREEPGEHQRRDFGATVRRVHDELLELDRLVAHVALLLLGDAGDRAIQFLHEVTLRGVAGVRGDEVGQHARQFPAVSRGALALEAALEGRPLAHHVLDVGLHRRFRADRLGENGDRLRRDTGVHLVRLLRDRRGRDLDVRLARILPLEFGAHGLGLALRLVPAEEQGGIAVVATIRQARHRVDTGHGHGELAEAHQRRIAGLLQALGNAKHLQHLLAGVLEGLDLGLDLFLRRVVLRQHRLGERLVQHAQAPIDRAEDGRPCPAHIVKNLTPGFPRHHVLDYRVRLGGRELVDAGIDRRAGLLIQGPGRLARALARHELGLCPNRAVHDGIARQGAGEDRISGRLDVALRLARAECRGERGAHVLGLGQDARRQLGRADRGQRHRVQDGVRQSEHLAEVTVLECLVILGRQRLVVGIEVLDRAAAVGPELNDVVADAPHVLDRRGALAGCGRRRVEVGAGNLLRNGLAVRAVLDQLHTRHELAVTLDDRLQALDDRGIRAQAEGALGELDELLEPLDRSLDPRLIRHEPIVQDAGAVDRPEFRRAVERIVGAELEDAILERLDDALLGRGIAHAGLQHVGHGLFALRAGRAEGGEPLLLPLLANADLNIDRHHAFGVVQDLVNGAVALGLALEQGEDLFRGVVAGRGGPVRGGCADADPKLLCYCRVLVDQPLGEIGLLGRDHAVRDGLAHPRLDPVSAATPWRHHVPVGALVALIAHTGDHFLDGQLELGVRDLAFVETGLRLLEATEPIGADLGRHFRKRPRGRA